MKKLFYLTNVALISLILTTTPSHASAAATNNSSQNQGIVTQISNWLGSLFGGGGSNPGQSMPSCSGDNGSGTDGVSEAHLPINNGLVVLMVAGAIGGVTILQKRSNVVTKA